MRVLRWLAATEVASAAVASTLLLLDWPRCNPWELLIWQYSALMFGGVVWMLTRYWPAPAPAPVPFQVDAPWNMIHTVTLTPDPQDPHVFLGRPGGRCAWCGFADVAPVHVGAVGR